MANGKDNVVPLKAPQRGAAIPKIANKHEAVASLPRGLQAVHLLLSKALQQGLNQFFSNADDSLFERADTAGSNLDQSSYFEAMRSLRLVRVQLSQDSFAHLRQEFIDLNKPQRQSQVSIDAYADDELLACDVEMLSEDALEEEVAIKAMVSKQLAGHSTPMEHLWRRCFHMLDRRGSDELGRLPTHPQRLAEFFVRQLDGLSMQIKIKLILLKLFERTVLAQLGQAYNILNQRLAQQGVLPDLQRQISRERRARFNHRQTGMKAETVVQGQVLGEIHRLLAEGDALLPDEHSAVSEDSVVLSSGQLGSILARLQGQAMPVREQGQQLAELISNEGHISQLDRNIINLVHMLFEYIWEDPNLAAPMRAILSQMQIPLIKVALVDGTFLQAGSHPARQLLNEMARCALGWEPAESLAAKGDVKGSDKNSEEVKKDPLMDQLQLIVSRVQSEFDEDISLFNELHQQLKKFLDREHRRAELVTQRTVDHAKGQALSQQAKATVEAVLTDICVGLPPCAQALLQQAWSRVLQMIVLKHGVESLMWQEKLDLSRQFGQLLLTPEQQACEAKLTPLVNRMEADLAEIGLDSFQSRRWFEPVEVFVQQQQLRLRVSEDLDAACSADATEPAAKLLSIPNPASDSKPLSAPKPLSTPKSLSTPKPATEAKLEAKTATAESKTGEAKRADDESAAQKLEPLSPADPAMRQARRLSQGAWLQYQKNDSTSRCRLAAILPAIGRYIFVNRQGKKILELNLDELGHALKSNRLQLLNDGQLFDRALQAVIGDMRKQRERS